MELIRKYFNNLSEEQLTRFEALGDLYRDWNAKINLISRKDIENLYERHVLHSLAIAKMVQFQPAAEVLDLGTGGGFPGIPLAILFPEVRFHLVDGTAKKIMVVNEVAQALGLSNVKAEQTRAEEIKSARYDFVVTRAVAELPQLKTWCAKLLKIKHLHAIPNGIIALKGGNIKAEIKTLPKGEYVETYPVSDFFEEEYFEGKFVVYVQA